MMVLLLVSLLMLPGELPGRARILVGEEVDQWTLHAVFENMDLPAGILNYRLEIRKSGASGTSSTSQSGKVETAPGRADTLAVSRLNVSRGDHLHARLVVLQGDRIIGEDALDCTLPCPAGVQDSRNSTGTEKTPPPGA